MGGHHAVAEDGDVVELLDHGVHVARVLLVLEACEASFVPGLGVRVIPLIGGAFHTHDEGGPVDADQFVELDGGQVILSDEEEEFVRGFATLLTVAFVARGRLKDIEILRGQHFTQRLFVKFAVTEQKLVQDRVGDVLRLVWLKHLQFLQVSTFQQVCRDGQQTNQGVIARVLSIKFGFDGAVLEQKVHYFVE